MTRLLLAALLLPALSLAQPAPSMDIQQFKPVTDVHGFSLVQDASLLPQFRAGARLYINYGHAPLEVNAPGAGRQFGLVDGVLGIDLVGAFALVDFWEIGLHLPVVQAPFETSFVTSPQVGGKAIALGMGDVRINTRLRALDPETSPVGIAGDFFLTLPTGARAAGLGRGLPGGGATLAVSGRWPRVHFAANLGYAVYPRATLANLTTDDEVQYGAAVGVTPLLDKLDIQLEFAGSLTPGPNDLGEERFFDPVHSPLEMLLGARVHLPMGFSLNAGAGKGITPGFGSTDFRVLVGVDWAFMEPIDRDKDGLHDREDQCKKEPEDIDNFEDTDGCPDPDNDGDGLLDASDMCPDAPEDFDGWQDGDGCPEPDNDEDGVGDSADNCPIEAEDLDGFEDTDGCPDPDNDGDGIEDAADFCPNQAETVDGWADEDGCPDPDNDNDGVLDEDDLCPTGAEDRNGVRDDDGCPDSTLAILAPDRIRHYDAINFTNNRSRTLDDASKAVVQAAAKLLLEHPEVTKVRVEGHASNSGSASSAKKLSERRAQAVVDALVEWGVSADRLVAEGLGQEQPIASNRTSFGRDANERVDLIVVELAAPAPVAPPTPAAPTPWEPSAPVETPNPWGQPAPTGVQAPASPWGQPAPAEPAPAPVQGTDNPWGAPATPPAAGSDEAAEEEEEEAEPARVQPGSSPW